MTTGILPSSVFQTAPCLTDGPLAEVGRRVVVAALALGRSARADIVRVLAVPRVFEACERIFASDEPAYPAFARSLEQLAAWLEAAGPFDGAGATLDHIESVEAFTASHYGNLFAAFDAESYWEEPLRLLRDRLITNGIEPGRFRDLRVLDAGCGGGRYAAAWRALGAAHVTGVDMSWIGVADAARRAAAARVESLVFAAGSVLQLPFAADTFDVVFSNGVLHHSRDWEAGVRETVRVLRPGGFGWIYVIEEPGGIFWESVEILRVMLSGVDPARARAVLRLAGLPPNRIFYMLDHVMVPINVRLTPDQVAGALRAAGARAIARLTRGTSFDRVEQIYRGIPYASDKFGVGENRFTFSK